jgi:hexosaminidase
VVEGRDHRPPQRVGDDESYTLDISGGYVQISANRCLGAMRGLETLLQLVTQNKTTDGTGAVGFSVPAVSIRDEPRFGWRGLTLDVARHFIPVGELERTIDGLSAVKLNVLHLHLSDSEGFRVESKRFPRLTRDGSDGLYYTQTQIRGLIVYARDRGVRIVPEFDMPGHATSWLVGYPSLGSRSGKFEIARYFDTSLDLIDPTRESTYRFLDGFIGEMAKLFPDEYFHIGGDEINPKEWNENPRIRAFMQKHDLADAKALQAYFNRRLLKIVTKHGKRMIGWDEILEPELPKSIVVQSWRGQGSLWQSAREGFSGILSAGYYLDLMYPASYHYSVDPMKAPPPAPGEKNSADAPAPGTPSGLTPEQAKRILGGEAAMWTELASPENLDAKLWPRLAAIAERFWSTDSVTDVQAMYRRLGSTNRWLEWLDLRQRSNLELMRQRLAGDYPVAALDAFASVLEPVKGYSRNAERYTMFTPLNRLVDTLPPESDGAREFRDKVDSLLSGNRADSVAVGDELKKWQQAIIAAQPMLRGNSFLTEDLAAAARVNDLCRAGLEALENLEHGASPRGWKDQALTMVRQYNGQRVGDLLIQIAPAIQKLVEAAP